MWPKENELPTSNGECDGDLRKHLSAWTWGIIHGENTWKNTVNMDVQESYRFSDK